MAKSSKARQPRAISQAPFAPEKHYRASLYAERQKFGDKSRMAKYKQSSLFDIPEDELQEGTDVTGLNLSMPGRKALHAVMALLDRVGQEGKDEETYHPSFRWTGRLPQLEISLPEYFELYGLERIDGRYQGKGWTDAFGALRELTKTQRICYERRRWTGEGKSKKQVTDLIVTYKPLIMLDEGYQGLTSEETARVKAGKELHGKIAKLRITPSPLLMDGIHEGFYVLKSIFIYKEIEDLLEKERGKKARVSETVFLFVDWLQTLNKATWKASMEYLAETLRIESLVRERHWSRLSQLLEEAIDVALKLGYLLEAKPTEFAGKRGGWTFKLNPERCRRVKRGSELPEPQEQA